MSNPTREYGSHQNATATATNGTATATIEAPSGGLRVYVTGVSGSFDATASGISLTLKSGTTTVARWYVYDSLHIEFSSPIPMTPGEAANLELAAGGSGIVGDANIHGYIL